eukprot:UN25631
MAMHNQNLEEAVSVLEPLGLTSDTQSMWKQLSEIAIKQQNFIVAQHCYSIMRQLPMAELLAEINEAPVDSYERRAKIAIINKQFKRAEKIYIQNNKVNEAIWMNIKYNLWEQAIMLAQSKHHDKLDEIKETYFQHLIETKQFHKAGELKESQREYAECIPLYLQAGLPARAANILQNTNVNVDPVIVKRIPSALIEQKLYDEAGIFYENMSKYEDALQCYIDGNIFSNAVEL